MTKRNTMQKEIIRSTLCSMCTHPTAAMLYDEVHRVHPRISRSTVYRTWQAMVHGVAKSQTQLKQLSTGVSLCLYHHHHHGLSFSHFGF